MDYHQYLKRKAKLELIVSFEDYSLYYDRGGKSLWIWNGSDFIGKDVDDLYEELMELV